MDIQMNPEFAKGYTSKSQMIRVVTEHWMESNVYCPCCGNSSIDSFPNNQPVADFYCPICSEEFELKSKSGGISGIIPDGAYSTMITRIQATNNPHFFFLNYDRTSLKVRHLMMVPKHFFTPDIIEKRKPLSDSAHRAGWVGCNIVLQKIPHIGKIDLIKAGQALPAGEVVEKYQKASFISDYKFNLRGWILDTLNCIEKIDSHVFSLESLYKFADELQGKYPNNHHIKDKLRQQLQLLRDHGLIEFTGRGLYKKLF